MRMYDIIHKKRDGGTLSDSEIELLISQLDNIPDYQISALLMAIYFKGLSSGETSALTRAMASSGDVMDLSAIEGVKVDKHSTGGVGDKTTLIVGPIAAACGVKVAKMSGRGLGHTGGTVDKLESIPGLRTSISQQEFFDIVNRVGLSVIGQTGRLCPADKKLYALRDVTATVESIPLIAASIMSKKLAAGADAIVLDVKTGDGAFMKSPDEAKELAEQMVNIGRQAGRQTSAMITDMSRPLGKNVGNSLEIMEVCRVLRGQGTEDLNELCLALAAEMIYLGKKAGDTAAAREMAKQAIQDGSAFRKLLEMVEAQGGDSRYLEDLSKFELSAHILEIRADRDGYIYDIAAESVGLAAGLLGAGRQKKDDKIDFGAGIELHRQWGQPVQAGEIIATLYTSNEGSLEEAGEMLKTAIVISEERPPEMKIVLSVIN